MLLEFIYSIQTSLAQGYCHTISQRITSEKLCPTGKRRSCIRPCTVLLTSRLMAHGSPNTYLEIFRNWISLMKISVMGQEMLGKRALLHLDNIYISAGHCPDHVSSSLHVWFSKWGLITGLTVTEHLSKSSTKLVGIKVRDIYAKKKFYTNKEAYNRVDYNSKKHLKHFSYKFFFKMVELNEYHII